MSSILLVLLVSWMACGCSYFFHRPVERTVKTTVEREEATEARTLGSYELHREGEDVVLTLKRWDTCKAREVERDVRVRTTDVDDWALIADYGAGAFYSLVGVSMVGEGSYGGAAATGTAGLVALGSGAYYTYREMTENAIPPRAHYGEWESKPCNDRPVTTTEVAVFYGGSQIGSTLLNFQGQLRFGFDKLMLTYSEEGDRVKTNTEIHVAERVPDDLTGYIELRSDSDEPIEIRLPSRMVVQIAGGREALAFERAERVGTPAVFEQFLNSFPNGEFADVAYSKWATALLDSDARTDDLEATLHHWRNKPRAQIGRRKLAQGLEVHKAKEREEALQLHREKVAELKRKTDQESIVKTMRHYNGLYDLLSGDEREKITDEMERYKRWARGQVPMSQIERDEIAFGLYPVTATRDDYSVILRNPRKMRGKRVVILANVIQKVDGGYLMDTRFGTPVFVTVINPHILNGFRVGNNWNIHAEVLGSKSYKNLAGEQRKVPFLKVFWVSG